MSDPAPSGFSNLQHELLKLYASNVSEEDLQAIRYLIGLYFAEKATLAMERFVEEKKMTPQQIAQWAYEHWRAENRS